MAKPSPTLIGVFVLGGIALLVGGLLIFGASNFFRENQKVVSFFPGSVAGLTVGAPVTFRGVPIGSVTAMQVSIDRQTLDTRIPIYYEFDPSRFTWEGDPSVGTTGGLEKAIRNGLRAQLVLQSLVTGQLAIQLTIAPGSPMEMVGARTGVPEIPTMQSDIEALKGTLEELPLADLVTSATRTVERLDELLRAPETGQALASLNATLQTVKSLAEELRTQIPPLVAEIRQTSQSTQQTVDRGKQSLDRLDAALTAVEQAFRQARTTFDSANGYLSNEGLPYQNVQSTLSEIEAAARAVRRLAEAIERDPSMLITGKR